MTNSSEPKPANQLLIYTDAKLELQNVHHDATHDCLSTSILKPSVQSPHFSIFSDCMPKRTSFLASYISFRQLSEVFSVSASYEMYPTTISRNSETGRVPKFQAEPFLTEHSPVPSGSLVSATIDNLVFFLTNEDYFDLVAMGPLFTPPALGITF